MLRASATEHGIHVDLRAVRSPAHESGVPAGAELLAFTDAVVLRDDAEVVPARDALVAALGVAATVRAAAVAANFEMMNLLLDGAGVPVPAPSSDLAASLGLAR